MPDRRETPRPSSTLAHNPSIHPILTLELIVSNSSRYLPPLRAVLLSFDPSPSFAHPTERFPSRASPFSNSTANKDPSRLLHSDDDTQDDDDDASGQLKAQDKVKLKVLPMIAGSGFTLANVQFKGMAWRPQVGQRIGETKRKDLLVQSRNSR